MTKGRKTTFDERVEIVQYCITHGRNYTETSEKYGISYQQARNYTVKYESGGVDALKDRRGKRKALDLNEIVQGRFPADFAGKPVPFSVADLQAVMLTGAVGAASEMHQFLRFISSQIGQQVHLTGSRYHLRRDIWHMFHLHSDIKIAEGLSFRKPLGYVMSFSQIYLFLDNIF